MHLALLRDQARRNGHHIIRGKCLARSGIREKHAQNLCHVGGLVLVCRSSLLLGRACAARARGLHALCTRCRRNGLALALCPVSALSLSLKSGNARMRSSRVCLESCAISSVPALRTGYETVTEHFDLIITKVKPGELPSRNSTLPYI
jgi:hypothetical protein